MSTSLPTALAALGCVLALIWLVQLGIRKSGSAWHFARSHQPHAHKRLLSIVDSLRIDTNQRLHLVRCADRQVLLLTGAAQVQVVGWIDQAPDKCTEHRV